MNIKQPTVPPIPPRRSHANTSADISADNSISGDIFKRVIEKYGSDYQIGIAQEECAELIQALSKCRRFGCVGSLRDNLIEEIADVRLCIEEMQIVFGISTKEIVEVEGSKLLRLQKRLEEGK